MSDTRYCKDCKWVDMNYDHSHEWTCHRGHKDTVDPVTGVLGWHQNNIPCKSFRRGPVLHCTIKGVWWEPRGT